MQSFRFAAVLCMIGLSPIVIPAQELSTPTEIVLNDQSAQTDVRRTMEAVDRRTQAVLESMGLALAPQSMQASAGARRYEARGPSRIVSVALERLGRRSTRINVTSVRLSTSRLSTLEYDTRHARAVVDQILQDFQ